MKWKTGRRSGNVVDVRGARPRMGSLGGTGGRLGIGGVVLVVVLGLLTGQNPLDMLGAVTQMSGGMAPTAEQGSAPPANDEAAAFVSTILGETEVVWEGLFSKAGGAYQAPRLVLFSQRVGSACGSASSASGPFYCPGDRQVYLDMSFFQEMEARLGGGGDFAYAYVIAHEVGHHVQTLLGVSERVARERQRGRKVEGAGGLLVRQELQADCYAGVWAWHAEQRLRWLEAGDVEEALNTASAIGDDRLQRQSQGTVVPDAFTHGSAEQRARWFRTGFESGDPQRCDTFAGGRL